MSSSGVQAWRHIWGGRLLHSSPPHAHHPYRTSKALVNNGNYICYWWKQSQNLHRHCLETKLLVVGRELVTWFLSEHASVDGSILLPSQESVWSHAKGRGCPGDGSPLPWTPTKVEPMHFITSCINLSNQTIAQKLEWIFFLNFSIIIPSPISRPPHLGWTS